MPNTRSGGGYRNLINMNEKLLGTTFSNLPTCSLIKVLYTIIQCGNAEKEKISPYLNTLYFIEKLLCLK